MTRGVPEMTVDAMRDEMVGLERQHAELEGRLDELDGHVYLTPDEQLERKQIQKMKLRLKDRIRVLGNHLA